ncbi:MULTISPECIES: hypothetical protein [Streptomyces]|uniref:Uncharacterized protein n=1 Tax=Streptomyces morookaense TaxID=1970 RepID=A0A7Y7B7Z0_STRMO|nr:MULTISPECIES: hypothetical protein [Streptomyces]MCC2279856.1 hypothetical protein [Streptomyces sp. ET3-23]NVK80514.1 hypothetical protein [Streptomyces morookaense]GHF46898.1 hypothetical protein GCM10010359_56740 [Streptomyces morookaense]
MRIRILKRPKLVLSSFAGLTALGAIGAALVGPALPITGKGTFCLARSTGTSLTGIEGASTSGGCATLSDKGTLSTDLTTGEIPFQGGLRLYTPQHRLDVRNLVFHIDSRTATADLSVDDARPAHVTFLTYSINPGHVTVAYPSVKATSVSLHLAGSAGPSFLRAFPASPVGIHDKLLVFNGTAAFTKVQ